MRGNITLLTLFLLILVVLTTSCNSGSEVRYITGNTIYSEPPVEVTIEDTPEEEIVEEPEEIKENVLIEKEEDFFEGIEVISEKDSLTPITTKEEELINSKRCDKETVFLGYHSCYNLSTGDVLLILKNQGQDPVTGIWFNIEVRKKDNYESVSREIKFLEYEEFILPLNKWKKKYGSSDRIIIMPEISTAQGNKACPNRALLLVPSMSCDRLQ